MIFQLNRLSHKYARICCRNKLNICLGLVISNFLISLNYTSLRTQVEDFTEDHEELYENLRDVFSWKHLNLRQLTDGDISTQRLKHLQAVIEEYLNKTTSEEYSYTSVKGKSDDYICKLYKEEGKLKRKVIPKIWNQFLQSDNQSVTLVTQITLEKVGVLNELVVAWEGPLSIAVYIEHNKLLQLPDLFSTYPKILRRADIDVHIVIQKGRWYPVNFVRNIALEFAQTDYVFLVDADFIPNAGLQAEALSLIGRKEWNPKKEVLVVPAFDFKVSPGEYFPKDKDSLQALQQSGLILDATNDDRWYKSYRKTNYPKWKTANKTYYVKYEDGFEPYIIGKKHLLPMYDSRFLTRGRNKVQHLAEVHYKGFDFLVMPHHFVVHYPHIRGSKSAVYRRCVYPHYTSFVMKLQRKYKRRSLRVQ